MWSTPDRNPSSGTVEDKSSLPEGLGNTHLGLGQKRSYCNTQDTVGWGGGVNCEVGGEEKVARDDVRNVVCMQWKREEEANGWVFVSREQGGRGQGEPAQEKS